MPTLRLPAPTTLHRTHCPSPTCRVVINARSAAAADAGLEAHIVAVHWPLERT